MTERQFFKWGITNIHVNHRRYPWFQANQTLNELQRMINLIFIFPIQILLTSETWEYFKKLMINLLGHFCKLYRKKTDESITNRPHKVRTKQNYPKMRLQSPIWDKNNYRLTTFLKISVIDDTRLQLENPNMLIFMWDSGLFFYYFHYLQLLNPPV